MRVSGSLRTRNGTSSLQSSKVHCSCEVNNLNTNKWTYLRNLSKNIYILTYKHFTLSLYWSAAFMRAVCYNNQLPWYVTGAGLYNLDSQPGKMDSEHSSRFYSFFSQEIGSLLNWAFFSVKIKTGIARHPVIGMWRPRVSWLMLWLF